MIKYTKRPNIETLRRRCKDDRDIINTIRHEFTNYSKVQDAVYASEDAVAILRTFFHSVVALDKNLGCEAAAQFGNHIKRIAR